MVDSSAEHVKRITSPAGKQVVETVTYPDQMTKKTGS